MNAVFGSQHFTDNTPENNMQQLNALFMNLASVTPDNQSFALKNYFGDFYLKARFSIENTFDKLLSSAPITLRSSAGFNRFIMSMPYTDTMTMRAEIPEGLNVTFLEYLEVMLPAQQRANSVIDLVIDPFEKFVGKLISDEVFRNQSIHQIREFKDLESGYNKVVKDMAKCFGKNDYKASAPFSAVVKRNGDWQEVFNKTSRLRDLYQDFPQKEITTRLNYLYELLDGLVEQIRKDQYLRVEKEVSQLLSSGMYHIAKEVELAALTTFRTKTFITAMDTTLQNIEEVDRARR